MMVTLFKFDKVGRLRTFTVHDLQRSLLTERFLTYYEAIGDRAGKDRFAYFPDAAEQDAWLAKTLRSKLKLGYRELYRYEAARPPMRSAG
jgi:predicted DNA-binding WGR domain protein